MINPSANPKAYFSDLNGGSLHMAESRVVAQACLQNFPDEEWLKLVVDDNALQKKSVHTAKRYVRVIRLRLEPLGKRFIADLLKADERTYVQLLMLAFVIQSPAVADFMRSVLAEAHRTYKSELSAYDWLDFYGERIRAFPELDIFSDSTVKKMGQNVIRALVESGYLSSSRERKIQPVYLQPEVKKWINNMCRDELEAVMECTV